MKCESKDCAFINHICITCGKVDSANPFFLHRTRISKGTGNLVKRRRLSKEKKARILKRDNWTCLCCKIDLKTLPIDQISIDHIIPLILGGTNSDHNLQSLCYKCDKNKGTKIINYREIRN